MRSTQADIDSRLGFDLIPFQTCIPHALIILHDVFNQVDTTDDI